MHLLRHSVRLNGLASAPTAGRFAPTARSQQRTIAATAVGRRDESLSEAVGSSVSTRTGQKLDRSVLDALLRRRLFYTPSFEVYGGASGLYDYGPPGCNLQNNIIQLWRKHFVLEEDMLEVDCTALTPREVLSTSGHVEKFADWMCRDPSTGEVFRADHLIRSTLESRLMENGESRHARKDQQLVRDKTNGEADDMHDVLAKVLGSVPASDRLT